jgi:hypothetical protein
MMPLEPFWKKPFSLGGSVRATFEHIGQKSLADRLVFIHESWLNYNEDSNKIVEQVTSAAKESGRFPILCLSTNYYPTCSNIKQLLDQSIGDENYFILVADPAQGTDKNTAFWPEFLVLINQLQNFQLGYLKKYRISYLTGGVRYHRLKLWEAIRPYVNDQDAVVANQFGVINFENTFDHSKISLAHARKCLQTWLEYLPWSNQPELIDNANQTLLNAVSQWDNAHPVYNAMINITGETSTDDNFQITEKTWKAYRSGCLVVNYGPTHMPAYLKQLGLEVWQEYDQCLPTMNKIALITELFQRNDIADIYQLNIEMIRHNQNLVNSIDFIKLQTAPAINKLQLLL